jgi:predicted DNA-binding transcriptional regulator AlpA
MLSLPFEFNGRLTVSISEAAALLGVKTKTLYNQISAETCPIPTLKFGGRRLVRVADLLRLTGDSYPLKTPEGMRFKSKTAGDVRHAK